VKYQAFSLVETVQAFSFCETVTEKSDVEEGNNLNETDPSGNTADKPC